MEDEIQKIATYCRKNLSLSEAKLSDEYYYNSLTLCVIDAVFSIGVNYSSTRNVVIKYCDYFKLIRIREDKNQIPSLKKQESISDICEKFNKLGSSFFANDILKNKQRTSTKNGILKTQAVYEFCKILKENGVEYLQDVEKIILSKKFENEVKEIAGQKSGISLRYFFMLAGTENLIKPDRMILRFLENILGRKINLNEAQKLIEETSFELMNEYPKITARLLDHQIWNFQRDI